MLYVVQQILANQSPATAQVIQVKNNLKKLVYLNYFFLWNRRVLAPTDYILIKEKKESYVQEESRKKYYKCN
jgi:hypothetical protein